MLVRWKILLVVCFLVIFMASHSEAVFSAIEFNISNPVGSGDEYEVDVSLSGLSSSSCNEGKCYLQGMFTTQGVTKYFGFTQNTGGSWYEYNGSPEVSYIISTFFYFEPVDGAWSGKLKINNNPEDSDYNGPGEYDLKLRRYTGKSSSHAGESNTLIVSLSTTVATPTPTPTSTPTSTPTPTTNSTNTPKSSPTPKPSTSPIGSQQATGNQARGVVAGAVSDDLATFSADLEIEDIKLATFANEIILIASEDADTNSRNISWWLVSMGGVLTVGSVVAFVLKKYNISLWPWKRKERSG